MRSIPDHEIGNLITMLVMIRSPVMILGQNVNALNRLPSYQARFCARESEMLLA